MSVILIRTAILYFLVVAALRFMGKRQIAQLQASELVVAMILSDLATVPMQSSDIPLIYGIISILAVTSLEVIVSAVSTKSIKFQNIFSGKPVIIINDGKLDSNALVNMRISIDDLYEEMRSHDITHIKDIQYMIIESNGNMNFISKQSSYTEKDGFEIPLIKNGVADKSAIDFIGNEKLPKNIKDIVLYAVDFGGNKVCIKKEKK